MRASRREAGQQRAGRRVLACRAGARGPGDEGRGGLYATVLERYVCVQRSSLAELIEG